MNYALPRLQSYSKSEFADDFDDVMHGPFGHIAVARELAEQIGPKIDDPS